MMLYLELVNYCNMRCAHCCMDALTEHSKRRQSMSMDIFTKVLNDIILKNDDECCLTLGGGEPFLHQDIIAFIKRILDKTIHTDLLIITNGTKSRRIKQAIKILERNEMYYGKDSRFSMELSWDKYHDTTMVPDEIYTWFYVNESNARRSGSYKRYLREAKTLVPVGRAKNLNRTYNKFHDESFGICVCDSIIIKPNGDVKICGCEDAPCVGNVMDQEVCDFINNSGVAGTCYHELLTHVEDFYSSIKWMNELTERNRNENVTSNG